MTDQGTPNQGTPATPPSGGGMPKWLIIVLVFLIVVVIGCCGGVTTCWYWAKGKATVVVSEFDKAIKEAEAERRAARSRSGTSEETSPEDTSSTPSTPSSGGRTTPTIVAKMPANFPDDIPVYKNFTPRFSVADKTKSEGTVMMAGKGDRSEVASWYEKEMEKNGWKQEQNVDIGEATTMSFAKGTRKATIQVMPGDAGESNVNIFYQSK